MKITTRTLALATLVLALAVIPAMVGNQASPPTQALLAFDINLDAGMQRVG